MSDRNADPGAAVKRPTGKLKVLFLAADPFREQARLELAAEMRAIDQAIQLGIARDAVEFVAHLATRTRDVQYALLRHEPHIVHFARFGAEHGFIYLGDEHGKPRPVSAEALGQLFNTLDGRVRGVVLNGSHTLAMADELAQVVDFAIGHFWLLADEAALSFAEVFYSALAFGVGLRQAFRLAVTRLRMDGSNARDSSVLRVGPLWADTKLLGLPAEGEPVGTEPGEARQNARSGEMYHSEMLGINEEGRRGSDGRSADQRFAAWLVKGSHFNIVGRRNDDVCGQAPVPSDQQSAPSTPAAGDVLVGGTAPGRAQRGDTILVQFAAYAPAFKRQVRQVLKRNAGSVIHMNQPAQCQWPVGARVSVRCRANGLVVPTPVQHLTWDGRWRTVSFDVEVPEDARFKSTVVVLEAFIHDGDDAVQVAALRMPLHLARTPTRRPRARWVHSRAARKAFASYASQDRADVLARVSSIARSTGMDIFVDRTSLRMGEEWEPALLAHIAESERFLLFWSEFAAQSAWVKREMDEAIDAHGENVLELHLLRHVPAESIPERLRKLHFDDRYLLARDADLHREHAASPPDG